MQWMPAEPEPCPYLKGRTARLLYAWAGSASPAAFEQLLDLGCRTMTYLVYRTDCPSCQECRPLRIDADSFRPSRSQRRVLARNASLRIRHAPPAFSAARLRLMQRYHANREDLRGWRNLDWTPAAYRSVFLARVSRAPSEETSIWLGPRLVGVLFAHVTPNAYSLTYHFHDPELADRGLGTTLILCAIERARALGKRWVHLGYYVPDCRSLQYKAAYRPVEALGPDLVWRPWPDALPGGIPPSGSDEGTHGGSSE